MDKVNNDAVFQQKEERVVVGLDKLLTTYAFDISIFDQLNTPRRDDESEG